MDLKGLEVNINLEVLQGGFIDNSGSDGLTAWASFRNEYPVGTKVSEYTITTSFDVRNIQKDNFNNLEFDVYGLSDVDVNQVGNGKVGYGGSVTLKVNETGNDGKDLSEIWSSNIDLGDTYHVDKTVQPAFFGHYKIAPGQYLNLSNKYLLYWAMITTANLNDEFYFTLGKAFYNNNPAIYVPDAIRHGSMQSLNPNGDIKIRKGNWQSRAKESYGTVHQANQGFNRIRKNGNFIQQGVYNG